MTLREDKKLYRPMLLVALKILNSQDAGTTTLQSRDYEIQLQKLGCGS
jgi:hypothetical protein